MRRNYMDNLRNFTILLLFPVHTFMVWNDFGLRFYIWLGENKVLSTLIVLINPWFMPLLFVLAGMSARYALEKKSEKEFVLQRTEKLLIPFFGGTLLLVPVQTLYARKFFYGYAGGILDHWKYFFTHITDFTGYDGAFSPGHLWFILFLFLIAMITLVLFRILPYEKAAAKVGKLPVFAVLLLFLPIWLMYYLGNFGGFSIGKNLALYVIGYYVLSQEAVMKKLEGSLHWIAALQVAASAASAVLYYRFSYYGDLWVNFVGWNAILVLLLWGRKRLGRRTKLTAYLNQAAYPVYILHQTILVVLAYYAAQWRCHPAVQAAGICIGSLALTFAAYHLLKKVPYVRKLVGIP